MSKISFIKSEDRKYNVNRCLSLIKSEIISGLKNAKNVVIKPNCVVDDFQLAATHVDAIDAVLEFIFPYVNTQITLAEGSGAGDTVRAFQNYNYFSIQEKYNFAFIDLNNDEFENIELINRKGEKCQAQISKTMLNSDFIISVSPPKTHNEVVYTGAIKNVAVGSLLKPKNKFSNKIASKLGIIKNSKSMIHQGYRAINQNIKILAEKIPMNLAILDAFTAMQGDGPGHGGEMVASHWALASTDSLMADCLACELMGIEVEDVGYLTLLLDEREKIEEPFIIGDSWRDSIQKFKMHADFDRQKHWK